MEKLQKQDFRKEELRKCVAGSTYKCSFECDPLGRGLRFESEICCFSFYDTKDKMNPATNKTITNNAPFHGGLAGVFRATENPE